MSSKKLSKKSSSKKPGLKKSSLKKPSLKKPSTKPSLKKPSPKKSKSKLLVIEPQLYKKVSLLDAKSPDITNRNFYICARKSSSFAVTGSGCDTWYVVKNPIYKLSDKLPPTLVDKLCQGIVPQDFRKLTIKDIYKIDPSYRIKFT